MYPKCERPGLRPSIFFRTAGHPPARLTFCYSLMTAGKNASASIENRPRRVNCVEPPHDIRAGIDVKRRGLKQQNCVSSRVVPEKFSIAMCTYNGERFVSAQLESIAAQTRLPDEVIICDDGSDDHTIQILQRFAAGAPFPVRVEINSERLGLVKNFEKAVGLCEGDLITLADQDDVWLPEKLARIEAEFARSSAVGLVFSDAEIIDERSHRTGRRLWEQIGFDNVERAALAAGRGLRDLVRGATVTGATLAFRAKYVSVVLPIPENLPVIHDAWIALILSCVSQIAVIEEPLMLYRKHSGQEVGPRPRVAAAGGFAAVVSGQASQAMLRSNPYDATVTLARAARGRLAQVDSEFDGQKARAKLDALIKHFETRKELPASFFPRLWTVLHELLTARYFQFSNGFASALKDLVKRHRAEEVGLQVK